MKYKDECVIKFLSGKRNRVSISHNNKKYIFNETDKKRFDQQSGESVIEYTGIETDGNTKQSWAIARFKPGGKSLPHYHSSRTEEYYITAGQGAVILDGKVCELKKGDHLKISPNSKHQVLNKSKNETLELIVSCTPSWTPKDFHILESTPKSTSTPKLKM